MLAALVLGGLACGRAPLAPDDNAWRYLPGRVESLRYAAFRDGRQCWVYLPPGYSTSDRRYPVLYLNDGEVAFDGDDGLHVNRICEGLIRRGEIQPIIVVAIEHVSTPQRTTDYTPWPASYWQPNGGGDFYVRALRDTLKPEIDRRYRTLSDPANTAIGGASLGGLISAYAAYASPSPFGKVAAFSPTYDYAGAAMVDFADTTGRPRQLVRFYQDTGYPDDNYIRHMERVLLDQGFVLGRNLLSATVPGAEHNNPAWEHRFPSMLRFLFPS